MNKFIIIDQSLHNLQGHHYECSVSVAQAASQLGYEPIIISNRAFPKHLHPVGIKVIPRFEIDWFGNEVKVDTLPKWRQKPEENFFQQLSSFQQFWFLYLRFAYPKSALFLEKIEGSTSRLWGWIKQDLQLLRSIPLSNTLWGLFKIVWGLLLFSLGLLTKLGGKVGKRMFNREPASFTETLVKVLQQVKVTPDDHIFIHTLGVEQLEELYHFLSDGDRRRTPCYHILQRRDLEDPLVTQAKGMGLAACLQGFYRAQLWPEVVRFYSDTEELIERLNSLSSVLFTQVPIPFRHQQLRKTSSPKHNENPIQIVYLGDARTEKGYLHLPGLVAELWTDYIQPGKVKFTVQSNFNIATGEPGILAARLQLERYPASKVCVIKEPMTPDAYYQLLADADLLVLPYQPESYRVRTSGVFVEALGAGKPVVVPSNSWLATQVDPSRAVVYDHPNQLSQAVVKIVENLDKFAEAAYQYRLTWLTQHSPEAFVKILLEKPNFSEAEVTATLEIHPARQKPKLLYISEGDIFLNPSHQGQVALNHLEYLSRCGYDIYGLFFPKNRDLNQEKFTHFSAKLQEVIQDFPWLETWIINYSSNISLPGSIEPLKYVQDVYYNRVSLERDLAEQSNLEIPHSLYQLIQTKSLDAVFLSAISQWGIVEKLALDNIPIICEIPQLYAYQSALANHRNLEAEEFKLECQLLNQCNVLLGYNCQELEKVAESVNKPQLYLLPNHLPWFSDKVITSPECPTLINTASYSSEIKYHQVMNQAFTSLLGDKSLIIDDFDESKKIVLLYPWADILEGKTGASKRVRLLIDYLREQSDQIWIFSLGEGKDFRKGNVRYSYYQPDFSEESSVKILYDEIFYSWTQYLDTYKLNDSEKPYLETPKTSQDVLLWMYYQFRFDRAFINYLETMINWADVVLLEYPFWAATVGEICQQQTTKLVVTAHDILAKQFPTNSSISKIALAEEIRSLRQADRVISVSVDDQKFWSQYGLETLVIPNPVNLDRDCFLEPDEFAKQWSELKPKIGGHFCLFVGSNYWPNIEAVKQIRRIAEELSQQQNGRTCQFVVVGGCCEPEHQHNFIALGKVEPQTLAALYQMATLVISPLLSGTGTSVKIMEAMAYAKVILGTKVAFRGYPVVSGVNCVICDNLLDYSSTITDLLGEPKLRKEIGKNARKLAQDYDYRRLYRGYNQVIQVFSELKKD